MLRTSSARSARLLLQGLDAVNQVLQLVAVGGVQGGVVADRWRRLGVGFLTGHMSFSLGNGLGLAAGRQILPVDEAPNTAPTRQGGGTDLGHGTELHQLIRLVVKGFLVEVEFRRDSLGAPERRIQIIFSRHLAGFSFAVKHAPKKLYPRRIEKTSPQLSNLPTDDEIYLTNTEF